MSNITCGQCVCPIPSLTPEILPTDLCQVVNSTHSICYMAGGLPSWSGAFISGIAAGIFFVFFLYVIYDLFFKSYKVKK